MDPREVIGPELERRRQPGLDPWWGESWHLDFADRDLGVAGYARLTLLPNRGVGWYWTCVTGPDRDLVTVIEAEAPLPRFPSVEVRAEGLWADLVVVTPLDHVMVGVEAFAVTLDDPADVFGSMWGHRVPFGLDLEWDADGPALRAEMAGVDRYQQSCRVHGEVLVADEAFDVDGWGIRDHAWGVVPWAEIGWWRLGGRLDDGTVVAAAGRPEGRPDDSRWRLLGPGDRVRWARTTVDGPGRGPVRAAAGGVEAEVLAVAPVPVDLGERGSSRLTLAWCRLRTDDDRHGHGWLEHNRPGAPPG